jgi:transcriptional regulator with GAF, ATPase, and Fis domain
MGKHIGPLTPEILGRLSAYTWPGNVRELQNVIERAVILSPKGRFVLGDFAGPAHAPAPAPRVAHVTPESASAAAASSAPGLAGPVRSLEEMEREHIFSVLERTGWRVSGERGAAKLLGLKRTTLEARMKKLGISRRA